MGKVVQDRTRPTASIDCEIASLYVEELGVPGSCHGLSDPLLETEVIRFAGVGSQLLARLRARPLILNRQVATPNREMTRFLALAEGACRPPLVLTMPQDRFAPSINPWKRCLAKLPIATRHNIRFARIVSFGDMENRPFSGVRCIDGTPFLRLHEELMETAFGSGAVGAAVDATDFFGRDSSLGRYTRLFALLTCFGVLAESYVPEGGEREFLETAVFPAFEETVRRFGRRPAIVRLLPIGQELEPSWEYYPAEVLPRALYAAGRPIAAAKVEAPC